MNKKEFLKKIGDIEMIYSLPIFVKNYTKEHHALVQYKMLAFDLEHEIERLNNIINELEKELEIIDNIDDSNIIKMQVKNMIFKLKELKGSDEE